MTRRVTLCLALACAACSTPKPAPSTAPAATNAPMAVASGEPEPASAPVSDEPAHALPTECASSGAICTPSKDFAERICAGKYPEAALYLFGPKTPWKRAYLRRAFQAWYVGGHGEMRELRTNEEVIILTAREPGKEAMQVGGRGFDALRWDGTCVSLMDDEISFQKPPGAVPANITWKTLDPSFQTAFAQEKGIEAAHTIQMRICDTPMAEKEPQKTKCEIAREQLSLAISQFVGRGKALPALSAIP